MHFLENFFKGFICIHFLVTMDPRQHTDAEDETVPVEYDCRRWWCTRRCPRTTDDGSNTDIYLNMSGDGIEAPSIQDAAAGEQSANVHITTILICSDNYIFI